MARNYKANGFFVTNVNGYTLNHLVAQQTGVYGLYAFNSIGGRMLNSEAYYVNDGAFYIGQTPPQDKPIQTIVRNVDGWGSPIGFSATNMRYVTITKSRFYNNAVGIVPNALDAEKFPPPEDNVITDNDIFWNNFNFHQGKPPFNVREDGHGGAGADRHRHPAARRPRQPRREQPDLRQLPRRRRGDRRHPRARRTRRRARSTATSFSDNAFGLNGTDANGYDIVLRRQRQRQLLHARRRRDTALDPLDAEPVHRARTCSARPRMTRCSSGPARARSTAGRSTPIRPRRAIKPLEVFKP